ncbi:efflux transporter outer membrane subunit [Noviherbaspirillum sp. UKPF54]|uniref:efflux transporter outer membrane subunit n=1 Tax=Noviherbaspirillum sp. UKPF54 TaxID=2601898 RepID=UPI0011B1B753|nr:efflux transporter outer membrane subunit [Noviherbaspirillum sp. UKPF54]QDZ27419.1 efflux transporter outer membrane subunit [Noviherbaspirillum sp. UKPF54]
MTSAHFPLMQRLSRRRLQTLSAASGALLLTACAGFHPVEQNVKQIDAVSFAQPTAIGQAAAAWPKDEWWLAYQDAQLDQLMRHALANSPTLAAAQARIARAQASAELGRAADRPQVGAGIDASYGRQSENYLVPHPPLGPAGKYISQGQAAVNFGFELDVWGKNAALIRAADAQLKAAVFDRDAARLALTTSIARAYAQLATQYELQDVLDATQQQRRDIHKLIDQRVANGLDTKVEVKQAETNEAALRIEQEQLATAIKVTRLQLAALAGDMPSAAESIKRPAMSGASFTVPANLPLDLLGRRPELAAQRARVVAAIGDKEAARAQFYPNINLNALIGFQSIGLGQLFNAGSLINSVGPAVRLPIFDGGRLQANYAAKASDIDAAIAQYNQSVLNAAQDVAEQLTRAADLAREEAATREALAAAEEAHRLATLRYKGGLSPYLTVLTVETQLLAQRRAMASLKARRDDLQIALIRALGGGFAEPGTAQSLAQH